MKRRPTLHEALTNLDDEFQEFTDLWAELPPFTWARWLLRKRLAIPFVWLMVLIIVLGLEYG